MLLLLSFISPTMFLTREKDLILYRDVANENRYTTTKQHVGKYSRQPIGLCPRGNSFQQAQEKVEKRGTFKASEKTPYEPSELYNALYDRSFRRINCKKCKFFPSGNLLYIQQDFCLQGNICCTTSEEIVDSLCCMVSS